ncbi:hypothetical protein IGI04_036154, partial [Brassica rapa subsp. trilocularis]
TQRTSVAVRVSVCVRGCRPAHTGRMWLSLAVPGCPSAHTGRPCVSVSTHRTSMAILGCPSAHIGRPWLSVSTHISTLVHGLSTLALPMDCFGDFGARGLSAQYTQDHTGRPWLSISTHISTLVLGLSTLALPVDCLGDFGPRGLSVQYTQDVHGCPPRSWLFVSTHRTSVAVRVCPCVSDNTHMTSVAVQKYNISTLVLGLSTLTLPVDCSFDFGPRGLSVQYTQDVCGYPPAHTGCPQLSVALALPVECLGDFGPRGLSVQYTQDVRGCPPAHTGHPWLSVSTHRTSVGVRQHTQDRTHDVSGYPLLHISARWSLDSARWPFPWTVWVILAHVGCLFSTHRTSVGVRQHTQDIRGCPYEPVCVCMCPSAHTGRPWLSISTHIRTLVLGLSTLALPVDCLGDFGPRGLSVKYTQDVCVCPPAHTAHPWLTHRTSVAVPSCASAHTGRSCVSVSTHMTSVCVYQHTKDVRVCPCLSVSTHRTSVAVRQYTYNHDGPWTQHAGPSHGLFG